MEDDLLCQLTTDDEESIRTALLSSHPKSKMRQCLLKSLSTYHSHPLLFFFMQLFIGSLFVLSPLAAFYYCFIINKQYAISIIPIIVTISSLTFLSFIFIFIRSCDDQRNKGRLIATWERGNILTLLKLFFKGGLLIWFTVVLFKFFVFCGSIVNQISLVEINGKEIKQCFLYKLIFYAVIIQGKLKIDTEYLNSKLLFNFGNLNEEEITKNIKFKIYMIMLPVLCISFFTFIKVLFVKVKKFWSKFFCSLLSFINILYFIVTNVITIDTSLQYIFDYIQFSLISLLLIAKIAAWLLYNVRRLCKRKNSSFQFRRLPTCYITLYFLIDCINLTGYCVLLVGVIISFESISNESRNAISNIFLCGKTSFVFLSVSNALYFGHFFLELLYKPIAVEYIPAKLKDSRYMHCSRNINFMLRNRPKRLFDKI